MDYTERRKTKKNFFVFFCTKKVFLVFLLAVEVLLEADPNGFSLKTFSFFLLVFLLSVYSTQEEGQTA